MRSGLQLFQDRSSEKMCTRQCRKVIWDIINSLFLNTWLSDLLLLLLFSTCKHTVYGLSCAWFKFLWKTVNSNPPTKPFGIVTCTFPDNLSWNSCIQILTLQSWTSDWRMLNFKISSKEPSVGITHKLPSTDNWPACHL